MDQLTVTIVVAVLVVGVAAALAIYVIRHYVLRSLTWKQVEGRITYAGMETLRHPRSGARLYGARIAYEYRVNDQTYHGTQIRPDYSYTNREAFHREIVRRYREGRKIRVYVNPRNPSEAYLEMGVPTVLLVLVALAVIFMLAVFVLLGEMLVELRTGAGQ